jgi:hypothetical protein
MGMEHLLCMYTTAVTQVSFSGPTYFGGII